METRKNYNVNFDLLNILSCIAVVAMHVNSSFWNFTPDLRWGFSCFVGSFCSFAVPVFLMLSGANLIDYTDRYSTKEYFKKRFFKAVLPFLVWSGISIVFACLRFGVAQVFEGNFATALINNVLNTKTTEYYWFFIPLFVVYLCVPVFAAVEKEKRQKIFGYAILCGILCNAVLPYLADLCGIEKNGNFGFPVAASYLIYALAGYYLSHYPLPLPSRLVVYALGLVSFGLNFGGTAICSFRSGELVNVLDDNLQFARIFWSIAVFTLVNSFKAGWLTRPKTTAFLRAISSLSFGVYLIHYFVLQIFYRFVPVNVNSGKWIVAGTVLIYLVCLGVTFVLRKIPVLKKIVP